MAGIGERIRQARETQQFSQSELARRSSLTPAAIWQIEHGQREPTASTLKKLCEALAVSADWVLGLVEADLRRENAELRERLRRVREVAGTE